MRRTILIDFGLVCRIPWEPSAHDDVETLMPTSVVHLRVSEELNLTMGALESLYRSRKAGGWELKVYDYSSNTWRDAEEAFVTPGTYERAVLTGPGMRPVRVRVLPPGARGLHMDPSSAREVAVWRALGLDLRARHMDAIAKVLKDRKDPISLEEVADLLEGRNDDAAREAHDEILRFLSSGEVDR